MQKKATSEPKKTIQQTSDAAAAADAERRTTERRTSKGEGYTYIPMVGWYCRREESRRGDDNLK